MKKQILLCGLLVVFVLEGTLQAQTQTFTILSIRRKATIDKTALNEKLKGARSRAEVSKILLNHLGGTRDAVVRILERKGKDSYLWWTFDNSNSKQSGSQLTVMGTRALNDDETIYKRYQFREIFRDTLVVIDTLKLKLALRDVTYPADQYYLQLNNTADRRSIPVLNGRELCFTTLVLDGTIGHYRKVSLHNEADTARTLSSGYLLCVDDSFKEELESLIRALRLDKITDPGELADYAQEYLRQHYGGKVLRSNVYRWVERLTY